MNSMEVFIVLPIKDKLLLLKFVISSFYSIFLLDYSFNSLLTVNSDVNSEYYMKENICRYAAAMRGLKHSNICHMVGACIDPLSLVTEYNSQGSIFDILQNSKKELSWARIKIIAMEIARGLEYLHGQDPPIIHGSLTSKNILVNEYWCVKITDMSFVSIFGAKKNKLEDKIRWIAPEIISGNEVSLQADVYSFGMILYHLCTKKIPYHGISGENLKEMISSVSFLCLLVIIINISFVKRVKDLTCLINFLLNFLMLLDLVGIMNQRKGLSLLTLFEF